MPLLWTTFGSEIEAKRHPFDTTVYDLNWYLTFLFIHSQGIFYLLVAKCIKPKYQVLVNIAMIWPAWEIIDHVLFYSQSPVRHLFAVILMTYIGWYHNKYEARNHAITIFLLIGFSIWFYVEYDHRLHFINYMDYMINPRFVLAVPACYILWYSLKIENWRIWHHYKHG